MKVFRRSFIGATLAAIVSPMSLLNPTLADAKPHEQAFFFGTLHDVDLKNHRAIVMFRDLSTGEPWVWIAEIPDCATVREGTQVAVCVPVDSQGHPSPVVTVGGRKELAGPAVLCMWSVDPKAA